MTKLCILHYWKYSFEQLKTCISAMLILDRWEEMIKLCDSSLLPVYLYSTIKWERNEYDNITFSGELKIRHNIGLESEA